MKPTIAERARRPAIPCPKCGGLGMVDMSLELFYVLFELRGKGTSAREIFDTLKAQGRAEGIITITAINNRLEELRRLEFVDRFKFGRGWKYVRLK